MIVSKKIINNIEVLVGENASIRFEIAPALGGKILSVYNMHLQKEFLWSNKNLSLKANDPGADYDSNFWGGIDELIPNDVPEVVDSLSYPDHGELWTTALDHTISGNRICVHGKLPVSGLYYIKTVYLDADLPVIHVEYKIKNVSMERRNFLWKLHAALIIEEGDKLVTTAQKARAVYPESCRFKPANEEFMWPLVDNCDASVVPSKNNTMDFFYLYDVKQAEMEMVSCQSKHVFRYTYEKKIFPYQWYFASYGKFLNHYTAILEPASSMPVSVNEALKSGQCSVLDPGQEINTVVQIFAGEVINKFYNG